MLRFNFRSMVSVLVLGFATVAGADTTTMTATMTATMGVPHNTKEYNLPADKLALQGYDPCSYYTGAPAAGNARITLTVDGVVYRFVNEDNKKSFAADPYKYAPAYGGWCATAMAAGNKVEIDPKNYKISHGRLFVFYKSWTSNAINDWNKDEKGNEAKADAAWKKISGE